ncbi:hypothetical protein QQ054_27145 [Oscillatoria amoena NRMC-F 0135]|nr:hypothetical protein [Oscillatoria amoena NRMC-F 0135]
MNTTTNSQFKHPITIKISDFLWSIGIEVYAGKIEQKTFLPGIRIVEGCIHVDEEKMLSPGDILHEAGHLAIITPAIRKTLTDTVVYDELMQGGEEMGAIAWSWAALKHLDLEPEILFHPEGYKGSSDSLIENFSEGRYLGVPILQWKGLSFEPRFAQEKGVLPFPTMINWTV